MPVTVLTTIGMIADVAGSVGGGCARVTAMMGAGSDPHLYQPTASDVAALRDADLILYVGSALEARLGDVLARFSERKPVVSLLDTAFDRATLIADDGAGATVDPHLWMDVSLWSRTVPVITDAIAGLAPDCADTLAANAADLTDRLDALHGWIGETIATIPEGQRMLVTAHDAFGYFSRAYGITASEAIEGISTESEASIADIREVADFVVETGVPAVFAETTINPRTVEAMVAEVRARGHEVTIGGALYSDAMGEPGTPGGTYIGMMWENTRTITEALGGTPAPLPEALSGWAAEWGMTN